MNALATRSVLNDKLKISHEFDKLDDYIYPFLQRTDYSKLIPQIYEGEFSALTLHGKMDFVSPYFQNYFFQIPAENFRNYLLWGNKKLNNPNPSARFTIPQFDLGLNYMTNERSNTSADSIELNEPQKFPDYLFNDDAILSFKGDPDDEHFIPCSEDTLDRAKKFLSAYAICGISSAFAPTIFPGPAGSIDIHWEKEKKELLVNIPADPKQPATFYGDDYGKNFIKGATEIGVMERVIAYWITS